MKLNLSSNNANSKVFIKQELLPLDFTFNTHQDEIHFEQEEDDEEEGEEAPFTDYTLKDDDTPKTEEILLNEIEFNLSEQHYDSKQTQITRELTSKRKRTEEPEYPACIVYIPNESMDEVLKREETTKPIPLNGID